ncbi:MAG TPA: nuclease-related domain-containing protein [Gammaproteobacteria bacterium]
MELIDWRFVAGVIAMGLLGGAAFWMLARLATATGVALAARLPHKSPFAADLLADAGDRDRRHHWIAGRELAALSGALLTALIVECASVLLFDASRLPEWKAWAWVLVWIANVAVLGLAVFGVVRLVRMRRHRRFEWAARAAVGSILKRLNFSGNRVFHEVVIEGTTIDHVVIGKRGVFAINVVARSLPKQAEGRPVAELKNGKLLLAGQPEALPVGDAARNMTLLSAAASRVVGHRVPVRSVLAVPGWHSVANDAGNHLVLNDKNLVMLTSWNKPDAFLMDEDCIAIQAFLHEASRVRWMN